MNTTTKQSIKTPLAKKSFFSEFSKDYSLPDYQPEIKRLLKISANVLPPKMDFGMDDAIFSGNIDYYVVYLGVDNQMYCAPISDEYAISMPLENTQMGEYFDGFVDITPENISGRVTAPRKITIRSKLKTLAAVFANFSSNETFSDSLGEDSIKKLSGEVNSAEIQRVLSDNVTVTDEIILDTRDGDVRVICADGKVMLTEVGGNNNEMLLRGDAYVKILACREDAGDIYVIQRKLPIFASIPINGADTSATLFAKGAVNELSVIVDEGRISLELGVVFDCMSCKNVPVGYTKDMYSTACQTRCEYKNYDVVNVSGGGNCNFTSNEARTLEELGIPEGSRFIDASGIPYIDGIDLEDMRLKLSGRIKYNVLLENGGEYTVKEIEMPFVFSCENKYGKNDIFASADIVSTKGKIDGERISLDSEIAFVYKMYNKEKISSLEALHFGEAVSDNQKQTVVIFPNDEESVWSLAKKYCISPEKIIKSARDTAKNLPTLELDDPKGLSSVHHIII